MNLTKSPSQEHYDEGSDVRLVCSVDSSPSALFQWFHDGELMSDTGAELKLLNVHMHQRGNYTCRAFNNKTLKYQTSQPADVSVRTCTFVCDSGSHWACRLCCWEFQMCE